MDDNDKNYLIGKVDKIHEDIVEIKVTLSAQHESLTHHIRRTDILEDKVELLKDEVMKNKGIKDFLILVTKISPLLAALGAAWAKMKGAF